MNPVLFALSAALIVIGAIIALVFLAVVSRYFWLWIQAVMTGAKVGIYDLIGMLFRRVDARTIVRGKIMAVAAGIEDPDLTTQALEAHYLARGNVPQVIRALIAARKSRQITLSFREAAAIDLAGRDVLDAVQTSVYPKVIDCPPRNSSNPFLDAIAKDGMAYIDAPVSGGPKGAETGKLAIWVGGDKAVFDRCKPVLDAIGDQAAHLGPIGSATVAKLVHNMA